MQEQNDNDVSLAQLAASMMIQHSGGAQTETDSGAAVPLNGQQLRLFRSRSLTVCVWRARMMCPVRCCCRGTSKIVRAWVRLPRNLASVRTPCWISGGCDDRASSWRAVETSRGRGFTATCCWEELATTDWHRQVGQPWGQPGPARAANIYFIICICVYINSWASSVDSVRDGAFYFTIRDDPVGFYYQC